MDEDEVLGKITRLLEQGCTMLATHHSCGAPLFRCKGEVVCPVCSFPDKAAAKEPGAEAEAAEPSVAKREGAVSGIDQPGKVQQPAPEVVCREKIKASSGEQVAVEDEVRSAILDKLRALADELREERDLSKLNDQLACIDSAVRVLRSLSR